MRRFSGAWGTWVEILAVVVVLLTIGLLAAFVRARSRRTQGIPGKATKWDRHRRTLEIVHIMTSVLILISAFVISTFVKDKPPPLWSVLVGIGGVTLGAMRLFVEYLQKRGEARKADEAWTQKIKSLVVRWPLPLVSEVDPYALLGVTESKIASQYAKKGERPPYVPRDIDSELDRALATRDFVLLVGHSKAGKSRTAFEAVLRLYPKQWLIVPSDGRALAELFRLEPPLEWESNPAIIWLDDLQRFLGPNGLTPSLLNWLSQEKGYIKVIATLTSKRHDDYMRSASDVDKDTQLILQRFLQVALTSSLSSAEAQRAQDAYPKESPEQLAASLGEHLIAAHTLANKYEMSKETRPQGYALMRAAIDWRRMGVLRPIPETALRKLAEQYLGFLKLPNVDMTSESFKEGLQWAREPVGLNVALLSKVGEDGVEKLFEAFDYLVDHVDRQVVPIPAPAWESILGLALPPDSLLIGRSAYRRHHRVIARKALEQAARAGDPDIVSQASFALGVISQNKDEIAEAERFYRIAIGSVQLDVAAMAKINLGKIFMDRGDLAGAECLFCEVINSKQADVARKATVNLGVVYLKRRELAAAERIFRESVNVEDAEVGAIAKVNLGRILLEKGDWAEAERLFREIDPGQSAAAAMAIVGIGSIHWSRGELDEAERCFREVIQSKESDVVVMASSNLGAIHLRRNELAEAEVLFRDLLHSKQAGVTAMAAANLGVVHLRRGELAEAERLFREAIHSKQADAAAMANANLGLVHLRRNERDEGERLLREVLNSNQPDAIDIANGNLGKILMAKGELAEAERFLREVMNSKQVEAVAMAKVDLGGIHLMRGELAEAESLFREAIRSEQLGASVMAMINLGGMHMARNELAEAESLFRDVINTKDADAVAVANEKLNDIQLRRRGERTNTERLFDAAIKSKRVGATAMATVHLAKVGTLRPIG